MSYFTHEFEPPIEIHHVGHYRYTVVFLPESLQESLPLAEHPRLRVEGEVGEIPFEGAWQPALGRWYLMLSKNLMKDGEFELGQRVGVRFRVIDQDTVRVPVELEDALSGNPEARARWEEFTPGKRRGLSHHVASAKTPPTRARRVSEVISGLTGNKHASGPVSRILS